MFAHRLLSPRAYDASAMLVRSSVGGAGLATAVTGFLADEVDLEAGLAIRHRRGKTDHLPWQAWARLAQSRALPFGLLAEPGAQR